MALTSENFLKYTLLPGILPRFSAFFKSGFGLVASIIAIIYSNTGLLPAQHPYLDSRNFGRYGIRNVLIEASKNLKFSRKHLDQVSVYFIILAGIMLLSLQVILFIFMLFSNPVFAGPVYEFLPQSGGVPGFLSYFLQTPAGHTSSQDIAFVVLDNVFGVMQRSGTGGGVSFFNSCIASAVNCTDINGLDLGASAPFPRPIHFALHGMLQFYTMGIAFLSGIIILYFIVAIVGETVTSGTPFGRRFNKAWFLPRLVVFFALIAPISTVGNNAGINVAQMITFSVAKYGSNLATNLWLGFADTAVVNAGGVVAPTGDNAVSGMLGMGQSMIALPNVPEVGGLLQYLYIVNSCMYAEELLYGTQIRPYLVRERSDDTSAVTTHNGVSVPYNALGGTTDDYVPFHIFSSWEFYQLVEFARYKSVVIRFGHRNPPGAGSIPEGPNGGLNTPGPLLLNDPAGSYEGEWGYVRPTCGELQFELGSIDPFVIGGPILGGGIYGIQEIYYYTVLETLGGAGYSVVADRTTYCMLNAIMPQHHRSGCVDDPLSSISSPYSNFPHTSDTQWLTTGMARTEIEYFNAEMKHYMRGYDSNWNATTYTGAPNTVDWLRSSVDNAAYVGSILMPATLRERGWAGASLWYNQLATINGMVSESLVNLPRPYRYPKVMEDVADQHNASDAGLSFNERFNPRMANGEFAQLERPGDQYIAAYLYAQHKYWSDLSVQETVFTRASHNSIIDVVNMILGTSGLFDIIENRGVYPLAMLSALGKGMVDAALRNMFAGMVGQGIGALLSKEFFGQMAATAGKFAFRMGMIGLSIGFILYFVLPIMPFIYFFFAFGGWIKSIFEAVVAMPLWAVAHIRIDGEGLPGPLASNGYYLLFEIFLRPTLIIFGFVLSITLFAALVNVLHDSFYLLTLVSSGYDISSELNNPIPTLYASAASRTDFWRGPVDELFYTVIYTIIVYMLGLSCFKMVDAIPNNIMRWMGVTVSTFHETAGDPAGQVSSKMFRGTQTTNAQIQQFMDKSSDSLTNTQIAMTIGG